MAYLKHAILLAARRADALFGRADLPRAPYLCVGLVLRIGGPLSRRILSGMFKKATDGLPAFMARAREGR